MSKVTLRGKRALVTGASAGIGRAIALELAGRGVVMAIAARRMDALETVANEIAKAGYSRPVVLPVDLAKRGAAADLAKRAEAALGQVDILINNAGVGMLGSQWVVGDSDAARELCEINYWSPLALIQALVPAMRQRKDGAVVNVTSLAAVAPYVFTGHYSSTKAALSLASETLWLELKGSGVHALEVMPGPTETALLAWARNTVPGARAAMAMTPRGNVEALARKVVRGMERRRRFFVYPPWLSITPLVPTIARRLMTWTQRGLDGDDSRLTAPVNLSALPPRSDASVR
jgi:short-subunit dehydrogenase